MPKFLNFSNNVIASFDNEEKNYVVFANLMQNAANGIYTDYSKEETSEIIRNQFDKILGIDSKTAKQKEFRQAWRAHGVEINALVENILVDRMTSGWTDDNAFFERYVEQINTGAGDMNEFVVEDHSLLTVSKFAGSHNDLVRQALKPGKKFTIDTSWYEIKVYADFQMFMLGRTDFAALIDRMYESVEQYRKNGMYEAFMSIDESLPTDMVLETAISEATKDAIIEHIELVKSVTGKDVLLVGSRVAIGKLQSTIPYALYSNEMKNERYHDGGLGMWEGYDCFGINRVNRLGTRANILDNTKIYILPVDTDFKPIKDVISGDLEFHQDTDTWARKDRTVEASIYYEEGIGVVVNQLFGEIKIQG